jgi:organic radical activating enzyme
MTFKNTFCAAPWFQVRLDWNGRYRPCCVLKENASEFKGRTQFSLNDTTVDDWMSSEYSQYLRQELSTGTRLKECQSCWQQEDSSLYSLRQILNDTVTNNKGNNLDETWVKLFVDKYKDYKNYRLLSADIKLSNVCNFSCAMCAPFNSSKIFDEWQSDIDNRFVQEYLQKQPTYFADIKSIYHTQRGYQHLENILAHPIQHLKVLGGEPLLDKQLFETLQQQPLEKKSQINLHMVTNGSQDLMEAVDKLKDYKSVSFTVSLEGINSIQDYVRRGSDWSKIETNILSTRQQGLLITVNHTMQALTILNLPDLLLWCSQNQIAIGFDTLENPDYLSVSVLPIKIRKIAVENLSKIKHINFLNCVDSSLSSVDNIIELVDNLPVYADLYPKFLEYVDWFERNSIQKLRHIQPVFYAG